MSDQPESLDELDLDRRWNRVVEGDVSAASPEIEAILKADTASPVDDAFLAALQSRLQDAAKAQTTADRPSSSPVKVIIDRDSATKAPIQVPQTSVPRWATWALVAALVLAVIGYNRFDGRNSQSGQPTVDAPLGEVMAQGSPDATDAGEPDSDGISSGDPGNTRSQMGPAPVVPETIAGALPIGINGMDVSDAAIVTEYGSVLSAFDPETFAPLWAVDLEYGVYSNPVIAGDRVFISFTAQRDGTTEAFLGIDEEIDNRLLSFSLDDGSMVWSVDDTGAAPVAPIVVNGSVFSFGEAEGRWVMYASRATDGTMLWVSEPLSNQRTNGESRPTVSPDISAALAFGDGFVAVNYANGVHVFESGDGELAWTYVNSKNGEPDYGVRLSSPVISNGRLLLGLNRSGLPREDTLEPEDGFARVMAFDLVAGNELWTQKFGTLWEVNGPSVSGDSVVFLAWNRDAETYAITETNLNVVNAGSGDMTATIPIGDVELVAAFEGGTTQVRDAAPVLIGETAYVTTGSSDRGAEPASLLTAVDLTSAAVVSQTWFDGFSYQPIESVDGRLLFTTQVEGLLLVEGASESSGDQVVVTDLRTVNACTVEPGANPLDDPALANATPVGDYVPFDQPMSPADVPAVVAAKAPDAETTDAIVTRFAEYQSCFRTDEQERLYGFFSTDYYEQLVSTGNAAMLTGKDGEPRAPYFANSGEVQTLQVDTLQLLPDGRVSGIVTGQHSPRYVNWVFEEGEWRIDEWHSVVDRPDEETPER